MAGQGEREDLVALVEKIGASIDGDRVSFENLRQALGRRAFGPFLIAAGLLATLPTGLIPGVGWGTGTIMTVVFAQVLVGAQRLWLPGFITRRSLPRDKVEAALDRVRPWAQKVGRLVRPRLQFMVEFPAVQLVAIAGLVNALSMFPLGSVPFGAFPGSVSAIVIGIGLAVRDGVLMIVGIALGLVGIAATFALLRLL